jgi:hypothetical protein
MSVGYRYFINRGFLPAEASAYQDISMESIKDHRYLKVMIETRMRRFRDFYQKHEKERYILNKYYKSIRQLYVRKGLASNENDLILTGSKERRDRARTLTFNFFNKYKDKYAIRDTSGKVVKTPRKKTKANRRKITGKNVIDQTIRQSQDDINHSKNRLAFAKTPEEKTEWQRRIKLHQNRIKQLRIKGKSK